MRKMASPDKIDNRRGHCKCLSDAELERRTEADGPIGLVALPIERLGVIEPQDHQPEHVHPNRAAPALERRPHQHEIIGGGPAALDDRALVPRYAGIVEQRRFDGREADREEPEYETARDRERQLDPANGDLRADELIALGAPRDVAAAGVANAAVLANRPEGVATQ